MARVVRLISDITGKEADESEFTNLVIRSHPAVDEPKQLDVLPDELSGLKTADNLVHLEVGSNGDRRELVVSYTEFKKLVSDETVKKAPGTRGRRPGWSPKSQ